MDRIIQDSIFSLDILYHSYPFLSGLAVNDLQFLTMVWNVFLVAVALAFYVLLKKYWRAGGTLNFFEKLTVIFLFVFWLLFFPNAAYIITDVRHLFNYCPPGSPYEVCADNAWMIIFFFSYSVLGWVSFYYLLKLMSELVSERFNKIKPYFFAALIIPLTSLGVLLGLLNRFNSWDALFSPAALFLTLKFYATDINYIINWLVFTGFLYLLYFAGDVIFKKIKI
ncbi:MAG: DUF1361 domain-containing protein [bacterium]|nr:DUF1361 domain-containing protein [bacterium]